MIGSWQRFLVSRVGDEGKIPSLSGIEVDLLKLFGVAVLILGDIVVYEIADTKAVELSWLLCELVE